MSVTTLELLLSKNLRTLEKDQSILDFSNAKISQIGNIPSQISSQVQVLNLANNNLRSLQGIDQFKKLETLSLAHNKISKSQTLLILKNLLHLKKLSLNGNPFLQNPLTQEILTLLSSYENDLQILDFAFIDQNRQSLVKEHKRSKSQSRILVRSQIKKINSQQDLQNFSKALKMNKSVQKSKVNMLMSRMQQYIEEKHESQEMSSIQIDKIDLIPVHHQNSKDQMSFLKLAHEGFTPMKKSPKFGSFSIEQKSFNSFNQTQKFQEQSTNVKPKNISNSKIIQQSIPFQSRTQTKQEMNQRVSWQKQIKSDQKNSQQKNFQYQVNNLKINMDLDQAALNYPSIIEREDQDSYEIEFDFMSPKKIKSPQRAEISPSQVSPSRQLKGLIDSYVKIQEDEVKEQVREQSKKEQQINTLSLKQKTERPKISQGTLALLTKNMKPQTSRTEKKIYHKNADKQNLYQRRLSIEAPINLAKKGSLHESTRSVIPQSNISMAQDVITKLLYHRGLSETQSFSLNFSLGEMLQNAEKFEKFYFTSLTRLKPTFSLFYSPFNSLKTEEKDLLLQELFKNHKQIFILLIKEIYNREKLQEQLNQKNIELINAQEWVHQNKALKDRLEEYEKVLAIQKNKNNQIDMQSKKLKRYIDQFEDILESREKIISDTKREYQKINRILIKKQELIQRSLNQDQIQEKIISLSQARIKSKFLKSIQKKAQWTVKLQNFILKRQKRQKLLQEAKQKQLKRNIFKTLMFNLQKQKQIKQFQHKNNTKMINLWFQQWKIQTKIDKLSNQILQIKSSQQKKQFLTFINQFYLNKKRNRKILDFNKIRLQKKVLLQCFKKNLQQQKLKNLINQDTALKFLRKNLIQKYFQVMKVFSDDLKNSRLQKQQIIRNSVILKRQYLLFKKINQYQNKQQQIKFAKVQLNIIRKNQISLFLRNLKTLSQFSLRCRKNSKISHIFRLKKIFNILKKHTKKMIKIQQKFQMATRKNAHQRRLQNLIVQFRQNRLRTQVQKKKKESFYEFSKQFIKMNMIIYQKKSQVEKILDFRRGLRAKNELISLLRHENLSKKMNNKRLVMEQHYLIQESKYKQSYQLNILTMQQLKDEIQTYLKEIQFYKLQVQKLSQRELFILQQKQNCLLQIQSREEQNLQLKKAILLNEQKLDDLQRKYEKSLDMYAAVIDQMKERDKKIDKAFYYNTMLPMDTGFQTTFRREALEPAFNSLNR